MSAYLIFDIHVTDPETYAEYKDLAPAAIAMYGGKYLARGGRTETLEGEWQPGRMVILEFPTVEQAKAWLESAEYAPARRLRHAAATSKMVLVEGV